MKAKKYSVAAVYNKIVTKNGKTNVTTFLFSEIIKAVSEEEAFGILINIVEDAIEIEESDFSFKEYTLVTKKIIKL